jgi:hypothetical protein
MRLEFTPLLNDKPAALASGYPAHSSELRKQTRSAGSHLTSIHQLNEFEPEI